MEPEKAWARRESFITRVEMASKLDRADDYTLSTVIGWSKKELTFDEASHQLEPIFTEMFAAKDIRAHYAEKRYSLKAQRQAATDAGHYLMDSIASLKAHVDEANRISALDYVSARGLERALGVESLDRYPASVRSIGGIVGLAQRLEMRFIAQRAPHLPAALTPFGRTANMLPDGMTLTL